MGLGLAAVQNIIEMYSFGCFKKSKSILEIRSQELHCAPGDIKELFKQANLDSELVDGFENIDNFPSKSPGPSAKSFYNAIGLTDYYSIDLNGKHNSIPHDLNEPFLDK